MTHLRLMNWVTHSHTYTHVDTPIEIATWGHLLSSDEINSTRAIYESLVIIFCGIGEAILR